jgi:hypothetical protein
MPANVLIDHLAKFGQADCALARARNMTSISFSCDRFLAYGKARGTKR